MQRTSDRAHHPLQWLLHCLGALGLLAAQATARAEEPFRQGSPHRHQEPDRDRNSIAPHVLWLANPGFSCSNLEHNGSHESEDQS
jgi:hypothetical protein